MPKTSVMCIATNLGQADRIVDRLKAANFSSNDISVLFPDKASVRDLAHVKHTTPPEGPVDGTRGVIGGALGWPKLAPWPIPAIGPFIAAGPILVALNGAAGSGIAGGLIGLGFSESEAKRYEGKVKQGNILISVHADDSEKIFMAKDIFTKTATLDICTSCEASARDMVPERESRLDRDPYLCTR